MAEPQGGAGGLAGDLVLKSLAPSFLPFLLVKVFKPVWAGKPEERVLNCMKSLFSDVVNFKNFCS